ncbi:uncharacterized protein HD556DRAFT_1366987 [Suillus plorans]|uniref:Uncharacterized protein n=1 Tax=Suillus plorans TaxID=116603 RepID=A0A9P7ASU4_9AGAM|nr:uncharacterized protein HD556DRAFT_1366987 [Suillus plorans]KAG1794780.1 hypothetical protein HD556DRAFT_1366987 [Suillus plorans]
MEKEDDRDARDRSVTSARMSVVTRIQFQIILHFCYRWLEQIVSFDPQDYALAMVKFVSLLVCLRIFCVRG